MAARLNEARWTVSTWGRPPGHHGARAWLENGPGVLSHDLEGPCWGGNTVPQAHATPVMAARHAAGGGKPRCVFMARAVGSAHRGPAEWAKMTDGFGLLFIVQTHALSLCCVCWCLIVLVTCETEKPFSPQSKYGSASSAFYLSVSAARKQPTAFLFIPPQVWGLNRRQSVH